MRLHRRGARPKGAVPQRSRGIRELRAAACCLVPRCALSTRPHRAPRQFEPLSPIERCAVPRDAQVGGVERMALFRRLVDSAVAEPAPSDPDAAVLTPASADEDAPTSVPSGGPSDIHHRVLLTADATPVFVAAAREIKRLAEEVREEGSGRGAWDSGAVRSLHSHHLPRGEGASRYADHLAGFNSQAPACAGLTKRTVAAFCRQRTLARRHRTSCRSSSR